MAAVVAGRQGITETPNRLLQAAHKRWCSSNQYNIAAPNSGSILLRPLPFFR